MIDTRYCYDCMVEYAQLIKLPFKERDRTHQHYQRQHDNRYEDGFRIDLNLVNTLGYEEQECKKIINNKTIQLENIKYILPLLIDRINNFLKKVDED